VQPDRSWDQGTLTAEGISAPYCIRHYQGNLTAAMKAFLLRLASGQPDRSWPPGTLTAAGIDILIATGIRATRGKLASGHPDYSWHHDTPKAALIRDPDCSWHQGTQTTAGIMAA
jgi:hypothetical protein